MTVSAASSALTRLAWVRYARCETELSCLAQSSPLCHCSLPRIDPRPHPRPRRARAVDFLPLGDPAGFNPREYEHYEQVEHGDLNWIVPGKILAFGGPHAKRAEFYGYRTLVPEDFHDFFHKAGITAVIRLNKRVYDRRRFTGAWHAGPPGAWARRGRNEGEP